MIHATVARARTRAEWDRQTTKKIYAREIDRAASQVDPKLSEEDKGYVKTAQMGGGAGQRGDCTI